MDSGSSMSFVTECLARTLSLPHSKFVATISGIAGMTIDTSLQSLTTFKVTPAHNVHKKFDVEAIIIPHITCQLPVQPVHSLPHWKHLNDVILADPNYEIPQRINLLLGIDVFVNVMLQGRRTGPPGSPTAL